MRMRKTARNACASRRAPRLYEALAARYPDDDEAQIFSALYIAGTQLQSDQTYAAYLKAAAILEKQFVKYPDHPGVAHYLIHSYDAPPIAQQGLNAARRYADIAPEAPHALHMPSHIFTRVGAWEESAATNKRSAEAARQGGEPGRVLSRQRDYMTHAYLQMGLDGVARRVIDDALKVSGFTPARSTAPYAIALMPARYATSEAPGSAGDAGCRKPGSISRTSMHLFRARRRRGRAAATPMRLRKKREVLAAGSTRRCWRKRTPTGPPRSRCSAQAVARAGSRRCARQERRSAEVLHARRCRRRRPQRKSTSSPRDAWCRRASCWATC